MVDLRGVLSRARPDSLPAVRDFLVAAQQVGGYHPSPIDWRDEVLYFLLPDRFSDGREDDRPMLTQDERTELRRRTDRTGWSWRTGPSPASAGRVAPCAG